MLCIVLFLFYFCLFVSFIEPAPETTDGNFDRFYVAVKEALATEPETATVTEAGAGAGAGAKRRGRQIDPQRQENPPTLRQLRDLVRERQLQVAIRERLGKSVSECRKEELLAVLAG